jgi:hypothetical protein
VAKVAKASIALATVAGISIETRGFLFESSKWIHSYTAFKKGKFQDVQSMVSTTESEFVGLVKMLNFAFYELTVAKCEFVKLFLCFLFIKSEFTEV